MAERHVEEVVMKFTTFLYYEDGEVVFEDEGDAYSDELKKSRPPTARELNDIYGIETGEEQ